MTDETKGIKNIYTGIEKPDTHTEDTDISAENTDISAENTDTSDKNTDTSGSAGPAEPPAYNAEKLKKAQEASYRILLAIDSVCRKHGVHYVLDSGTLIGAVRHKGFIPWDDDVDIAMLRSDFERFASFANDELPDGMELVMPDEYRNGRAFYDFTPRVIFLDSQRRVTGEEDSYYEGKLNHLWVDIFILDNISDNPAADRLTRFFQKAVYGMSMSKRYRIDMKKYSLPDKICVGALCFAGRFVPMRVLFRLQDKLSGMYNGKQTENLYYSNYQPDFIHDTVKREWSAQVTELLFEDRLFYAPAGYDAVLTEVYGNYMKLPPPEKRIPSHSDEIDVFL